MWRGRSSTGDEMLLAASAGVSPGGYVGVGEGGDLQLLTVLREMEAPLALRRYGAGEAVYRGGEGGGALYVLTDGVARLFASYPGYAGRKDATFLLLGTGEVFGYPLFAGGRPRLTAAEAVTDCGVFEIPKVYVERAMRRRPEVALEMAALLELRLIEYEELIGCLLPRRAEARLAKLLPILARKFGGPGGGGTTIGLRLTRSDLAAMTASTREATTAAVSGLRESGILAMKAGRVVVLDPDGLAEVGRR